MITIVSGLPRSGTSLMMQMLERGGMNILTDSFRKADNDNLRGYYEYEKVKSLQKDNSWMGEAEDRAVKIIVQLLRFIHPDHDYSVIFMVRPIKEIISSQSKMLENLGQQGADLSLELLEKTFSRQVDRAQKWLSVNKKIHTIYMYYPEILNQPEDQAAKIKEFLGIELDTLSMASAVDISLWHQRS